MVILQASARAKGDTNKIVQHLATKTGAAWLDLLNYTIHPFNYEQNYPPDDQFLRLITDHVLPADHLILATPVYWYTMSAQLKTFIDRISDLLMSQKELGRRLRGMKMSSVSVGNDANPVPGFHDPFVKTANYLGMTYIDAHHGWLEDGRAKIERQLPF